MSTLPVQVQQVADRLRTLDPEPFLGWTLDEAARHIWAGWEPVYIGSATSMETVLVFTRPATEPDESSCWVAFSTRQDRASWPGLDHLARHWVFGPPFWAAATGNRVITAVVLPDLLEQMVERAAGSAFSAWVIAAEAALDHDSHERAAAQMLMSLGGCGGLRTLLENRERSLNWLQEQVHAQRQAATKYSDPAFRLH